MRRSRKLVTDALNSVDVFEDPIHFNMRGQTALTSSLGGAISLAIIIFLAIQAITQSIDMFTRDGPQIIQMNEFEDEPTTAYLNKTNNFVIAVAMTRDNMPIDLTLNTPMSFTSTFAHYIRNNDGTQTKIKADLYWGPCTKENFPSTIFPENTFSLYSLNYAYCPTSINFTDTTGTCHSAIQENYPDCQTPPDFTIQGTFLSIDFEFIQFKLKTCSPDDTKYIQDLQCTTEDINTVFDNSELTLNVYYSNTLIDPVNYHTPNKTYLDTIYWNVDPAVSTVADIFVDMETVQDFNDYFSNEGHHNRTFYSIQKDSMRELQKFHASSLLEWNIRRSNLNHITSRTYTKVLDVVSNIGGMSELFMLLGAFVVIGYARFKYQMILGNELYDFQAAEESKKTPETRNKTILFAMTPRLDDMQTESTSVSKLKSIFRLPTSRRKVHTEGTQAIKNYFELQKQRKRILNYNELSYLKIILKFLFCIKRNPDEEMARKARKQVKEDLDIIKVIEKLKEIDKLKMLLLNSDQRKTFDFIEKPLILAGKEKPVQAGSLQRIGLKQEAKDGENQKLLLYSSDYDSLSDYAKVYMAYRSLKDDIDMDNLKYNQRLLGMISEDLRTVFKKVDTIMGENADPKKFEEIIEKIMHQQEVNPIDDNVTLTLNKQE